MLSSDNLNKKGGQIISDEGQRGSAIVLALFVLALIAAFVALAVTRSATEAAAVGNEAAEGRTLYAAQGSLEMMTRNFNKVFETKLNPSTADLNAVTTAPVEGLSADYNFVQELERTSKSETAVLPEGPFAGLYAIRDNWRLRTTATDNTRTQVELTRNILNNRVPIFQFGIFYDDDLELFRPPLFSFGGRVHSNRHFFISPGSGGVYFDSRVTAHGHIVTQAWRNGYTGDVYNTAYIKDASGVYRQLPNNGGSVINGTPNVLTELPDFPSSRLNPGWAAQSAVFDGNLQSQAPQLKLPLKVGTAGGDNNNLIEIIKRGKDAFDGTKGDLMVRESTKNMSAPTIEPVTTATEDNDIMRSERFANKPGIRVSLSDSKAKLPGCSAGVGPTAVSTICGVRLDGSTDLNGQDAAPAFKSKGYQPRPMTDGYVATRANGDRLNAGISSKEVWMKIETVEYDDSTGTVIAHDITQDMLSLGLTEPAEGLSITGYSGSRAQNWNGSIPDSNLTASTAQSTRSTYPDSRAVFKIQRFEIGGPQLNSNNNSALNPSYAKYDATGGFNYVSRFTNATTARIANGCSSCTGDRHDPNNSASYETVDGGHLKLTSAGEAVVPFPIKMFDSREGLYYDERSTTYYPNSYFRGRVNNADTSYSMLSENGLMSMLDIDMANLRRFLRGDFDTVMPGGTPYVSASGHVLRSTDVPQNGGWVLYISDRRGDYDFDGEYDMEDIYGTSGNVGGDSTMQSGEDVNRDGVLNRRTTSGSGNEAPLYSDTLTPDAAAVNDHRYYRRGVRLINATVIPGLFDSGTPSNTRGLTVASENGVYVQGNYNATGISVAPSGGSNSPFNNYRPFDTSTHVPASIVADGVTILSNAWNDAQSFTTALLPSDPSTSRVASETTIRFAMISGDTIATRESTPNQGGISPKLNGGVHNFKRFLEHWTGRRLNYSGSLINLYNSANNNGSFKCCNTVYDPPTRNWVFDSTFLDPTRLPPGTPFFQYVQTTGFQRTND